MTRERFDRIYFRYKTESIIRKNIFIKHTSFEKYSLLSSFIQDSASKINIHPPSSLEKGNRLKIPSTRFITEKILILPPDRYIEKNAVTIFAKGPAIKIHISLKKELIFSVLFYHFRNNFLLFQKTISFFF